MQNGKKIWAHLSLLGTQLFFAINYPSVKFLINHNLVSPFGLNLVRVMVATFLLWLIWLFKGPRKIKIERADWPRFLLCGLTGIALNQMLFIKGLSMTYSIHASFLMLTTPIMISLFAVLWLKENMSVYKIFGLVLGIIGSMLLIRSGKQQADVSYPLVGDILVAINAVSYSFYFILARPLMKKYEPAFVLQILFIVGLVIMLPFCWTDFTQIQWPQLDQYGWLNMVLVTVGGTFFAYLLNIFGLKHLGPTVAGTYIYFQPMMTVLLAMIFLNEHLDLVKILAAGFIFAGVFLVTRQNAE